MKWIKDIDGDLVNLDHLSQIICRTQKGLTMIIGYFWGRNDENGAVILADGTEEACQKYMAFLTAYFGCSADSSSKEG